jgi:hypothetical protein
MKIRVLYKLGSLRIMALNIVIQVFFRPIFGTFLLISWLLSKNLVIKIYFSLILRASYLFFDVVFDLLLLFNFFVLAPNSFVTISIHFFT